MKHIETAVAKRLEVSAEKKISKSEVNTLVKALKTKMEKAWDSAENKANREGKKIKDPTDSVIKAFAASNPKKVKVVKTKRAVTRYAGSEIHNYTVLDLDVLSTDYVIVTGLHGVVSLTTKAARNKEVQDARKEVEKRASKSIGW